MSVGRRLVEERKRLGVSQAGFFTACGVSKAAQYNFESDINLPGGAYLIAAAALGVDITYVLTGQRMGGAAAPALAQDEAVLLDSYRRCTSTARGNLIQTAALLAAGVTAAAQQAAGVSQSNVHGNNHFTAIPATTKRPKRSA